MKILAISDIHSQDNENLSKYLKDNDIDFVLIAGDITDFGPLDFVDGFVQNIIDYGCEVIALPGNCDPEGICSAINDSGAFCLHKNIINLGDVVLFGYGGSNPTPFDTPGEIPDNKIYGDINELMEEYSYVANDSVSKVKILLTHAPPYDTKADKIPDGSHVGSQGVLKIIEEFQPEVNVCGHIHEAKSTDKVGETIIANPGMLKDNGAVLITVEDGSNFNVELVDLSQ